jgi:hypothetical protein
MTNLEKRNIRVRNRPPLPPPKVQNVSNENKKDLKKINAPAKRPEPTDPGPCPLGHRCPKEAELKTDTAQKKEKRTIGSTSTGSGQ